MSERGRIVSKKAFLERFRLEPHWRPELVGEPDAGVKARNVLVRLSSLAYPVVAVTETEFYARARDVVRDAAPRLAAVRCALPVVVRVGGLVTLRYGDPKLVSFTVDIRSALRGRTDAQPIEAG